MDQDTFDWYVEQEAKAADALVGVSFSQVDNTNGETVKVTKLFKVGGKTARVQAIELGPNEFQEQKDSLGLFNM